MTVSNEERLIYCIFKDFESKHRRKPNYMELHSVIEAVDGREQLQETDFSKKKMEKAVKTCSMRIENLKATGIWALGQEFIIYKGKFDVGYEYPCWSILLKMKSILLVKEFEELLVVFFVDRQHYFVAYWEKEESCGRQLILYKLESEGLKVVHQEYPH